MELKFAFELRVEVAEIQVLGDTPKGNRRMIPIKGGTFEGAKIKGTIQAGGYDWQLIRTDEVAEVDARYVLKTDDGLTQSVFVATGVRKPDKVLIQVYEVL